MALPGEAGQVRSPDLNWELILPDLPVCIQPAGIGHTLYVTTDRDLRRTNDDGETWTPAENGLPEGADIYRVFLSPDFAADNTVYLTGFGRSYAQPTAAIARKR